MYRGLNGDHHAFEDALKGEAWPGDIMGYRDGGMHAAGFTKDSALTSWTTDRNIAQQFMMNGTKQHGLILETTLEQQIGRVVRGPDRLGESEVLLRGIVNANNLESHLW